MKRLIILASGSKANAVLLQNDNDLILIDCGISFRSLTCLFRQNNLDISCLRAVLVTHCHSDHIKGIPALKKALDIPVYSACDIDGCKPAKTLALCGFEVDSFALSHDTQCCGYRVSFGAKTVAFATDTGCVCKDAFDSLKNADLLVIESNHDIDMLKSGKYPQNIKERILSDKGHLSNVDCAKTVAHLASLGLKKVVLAHISENNNTHLLAKAQTRAELMKYGFDDVEIYTATSGLTVEI